jgi:hypothetical protein
LLAIDATKDFPIALKHNWWEIPTKALQRLIDLVKLLS